MKPFKLQVNSSHYPLDHSAPTSEQSFTTSYSARQSYNKNTQYQHQANPSLSSLISVTPVLKIRQSKSKQHFYLTHAEQDMPWKQEETLKLINLFGQMGQAWESIEKIIQNRTAQQCRVKFEKILRKFMQKSNSYSQCNLNKKSAYRKIRNIVKALHFRASKSEEESASEQQKQRRGLCSIYITELSRFLKRGEQKNQNSFKEWYQKALNITQSSRIALIKARQARSREYQEYFDDDDEIIPSSYSFSEESSNIPFKKENTLQTCENNERKTVVEQSQQGIRTLLAASGVLQYATSSVKGQSQSVSEIGSQLFQLQSYQNFFEQHELYQQCNWIQRCSLNDTNTLYQ